MEGMSLETNRDDLEELMRDFAERTGFTFTVLAGRAPRRSSAACTSTRRKDGDHYAQVRSWVCADVAELDAPLYAAVSRWLAECWPFERVA